MMIIAVCIVYVTIGYLWWKKMFMHSGPEYIDRIPVYMIIWPFSVLLYLLNRLIKLLSSKT